MARLFERVNTRHQSHRLACTLLGVSLSASLAACATAPPPLPDARAPEYDGESKRQCRAGTPTLKPLVVEWSTTDRAELEALVQGAVVPVRYEQCRLEILNSCKTSGAYAYRAVTPKEDHVRIRNVEDLYDSIPVHAFAFEGKLARWGELNVNMTVVGRFVTEQDRVGVEDLEGNCSGATHFVRAFVVGAFDFYAGAASSVGANARAFGTREASQNSLLRDGSSSACQKASADDRSPPYGCGALLRLELIPLGDAARIGEAPSGSDVLRNPLRPENLEALKLACDNNHGPSCAVLGEAHEIPVGRPRDLNAAAKLYEKACRLRAADGCALLGAAYHAGTGVPQDAAKGTELLRDACQLNSGFGCHLLGQSYYNGIGVPADLKRHEALQKQAFSLSKAACEQRDASACLVLADLYRHGDGAPKNIERAVYHLRRACDAGLGAACAGYADMINAGEANGPADRAAVCLLLEKGCTLGDYDACNAAGIVHTDRAMASDDEFIKGVRFFEKACNAEVAESCFGLGIAVGFSHRVRPDLARAKRLFERACALGYSAACNEFARRTGFGIP